MTFKNACIQGILFLSLVTTNQHLFSQERGFFENMPDTVELDCTCKELTSSDYSIKISVSATDTVFNGLSYYEFMMSVPSQMKEGYCGFLRRQEDYVFFLNQSFNFPLFCGDSAIVGASFPPLHGNVCEELVFLKLGDQNKRGYIDRSPYYVYDCGLWDSHIVIPRNEYLRGEETIQVFYSYSTDVYKPISPDFYFDITYFSVSESSGFIQIKFLDSRGREFSCE